MSYVAGVKSCRFGWLAVIVQIDQDVISEEHRLCSSLREVLSLSPRPAVFAFNVPIGLLEEPARGGRECDRQVRRILGKSRGSSVMSPPPRSSLDCPSFEQAHQWGLSRQAFSILPRAREMEQIINPERQAWIKEAHPEMSFFMMDGLKPVEERRNTVPGRDVRMSLLAQTFHQVEQGLTAFPGKDVTKDDVLDAYAAAWTALRVFGGEAGCVPEVPSCDSRGVEMAIWY